MFGYAPRQLPTAHAVETQMPILLFLMTEPGHSQKIQATVWKLTQDLIWKSTRQFHEIILQLYHISQLLILLLLFMIAPGPLQKI